jgi:hypothetical protein
MSSKSKKQQILSWAREPEKNVIPVKKDDFINEERKPRLEYYRGLLSMKNFDIEQIMNAFLTWVKYTGYLIFRKENIYTYENKYKAVKAAKRGNDVYAWKLRKRLQKMYSLPEISFFNRKDRSKRQKTKTLFITLTYRRDGRIDTAWEDVGKDFNRWISGLRRRYGKIHVLRDWEAQSDGYPHIHCVLYFEEIEFETFFYNGKWRVRAKDELARNWHWGFSDMFALSDLGAGVGYVVKYLTKVHKTVVEEKYDRKSVLTLAMMWIFKKRAFSVSRGFEGLVVEDGEDEVKRYTGQVDLNGKPIFRWVLVGFWSGNLDTWSKELTYNEFWIIYGSDSFSENVHI